jgi:hypothetical protein
MPRCIECDLGGRDACDHIHQGGATYEDGGEFARSNRAFCDFLHRGILRPEFAHAKDEQEMIVEYV